MSTGKVHAVVSLSAALPTGLVVCIAADPVLGLGATLGCILGIPLTPDLDQITLSKSEWVLVKYIPVIGWLWMALWDLYARLIPHRSALSHAPIIGTLGRLLYLGIIVSLFKPVIPMLSKPFVQGVIIGLAVSDTLHCLWDLGGKK